ncbi:MAG: cytochrome c biogenesis protein ResB [Kiritimatiellae bacterium]|nr:cytochrome c biogenesis protein ResB [Kiritimatiellia bacterium]
MLKPFLRRLNVGMLVALAAIAAGSAVLGMERAGAIFRSAPQVICFVLGLGLAITGFFAFPALRRSPGRALIHAGWVLILIGAMWNSERGRALARGGAWPAVPLKSYLLVDEGGLSAEVRAASDGPPVARLPFVVALDEFRVEPYPAEQRAKLPDPERAPPRQYTSRVRFLAPDRSPREAVIQVNRPVRHEGYRFYQYSYDVHPTRTILLVVAEEGWPVAAAGLAMLALGAALACWGRCIKSGPAPEESIACT